MEHRNLAMGPLHPPRTGFPSPRRILHLESAPMRNHELRGIFVIGLLCLAALGVFLFGVLAKAEPAGDATRSPASPAAQFSAMTAASIHPITVSHTAGHLLAMKVRFYESKKERHYAWQQLGTTVVALHTGQAGRGSKLSTMEYRADLDAYLDCARSLFDCRCSGNG